jgi:hypothetical protein
MKVFRILSLNWKLTWKYIPVNGVIPKGMGAFRFPQSMFSCLLSSSLSYLKIGSQLIFAVIPSRQSMVNVSPVAFFSSILMAKKMDMFNTVETKERMKVKNPSSRSSLH